MPRSNKYIFKLKDHNQEESQSPHYCLKLQKEENKGYISKVPSISEMINLRLTRDEDKDVLQKMIEMTKYMKELEMTI